MAKIKLMLADNHTAVRDGLKALFEKVTDVKVTAEADDGIQTLEKVKSTKPEVLLMDISMPRLTGIDAIRQIKQASENTEIIILSMIQKRDYIREALHAGAMGYLLKTSPFEEVLGAVRSAYQKTYYLSSEINADIIHNYLKKDSAEPFLSKLNQLTRREHIIFRMMAEGRTPNEIAGRLTISPKTVAKHRTNLMEKLAVKNTATLVRYALQIGVFDLEKQAGSGD
ncbi:MAG: response regulator transcription factor [Desulfobacterales bacterium]|nr:response regulator transcription factor [Desulfobacterales bacterium]